MTKAVAAVLPDWVKELTQIIQVSGFETTERYGESWWKWETSPLIEAGLAGEPGTVFLQLGYLEGRIAMLKDKLKEAGIEVPENEQVKRQRHLKSCS